MLNKANNKNVVVLFTYGISLKTWDEQGIISRELSTYDLLAKKKGIKFFFITYGNSFDLKYRDLVYRCKIIPIYANNKKRENKIHRFLVSIFVPIRVSNQLPKHYIIKTNQLWGSWVAIIFKIIFKVPVLLRCGFEPNKNAVQDKKRFLYFYLMKALSHFSYKNADHIITTSKEIKKFISKEFRVPEQVITVNPNWVDSKKFKKIDSFKERKNLLLVGRLHKEKNLEYALKAFRNSDYVLNIVGQGPEKKRLIDLSIALNIKVNFLGTFDNIDLPKIYNSFHIYVICSLYEGHPKTLIEAMSCEMAVIGTNVAGINDVIDNNRNGIIVDIKNPVELRKKVEFLMENDVFRAELGKNARKKILLENSIQAHSFIESEMFTKISEKI